MGDHVERELIKKLLGDKPVAYHPILARVTGSVSSAVWLSQVLYWDSTLRESRDGWFWKTYEEMEQETCLNRHEQDRARAACKEKGIIKEQKKGLPLRIFYRVDWDKLTECLSSLPDADKPVCHTPTNKPDIRRQTISESTSESTTERGAQPAPASPEEKEAEELYNAMPSQSAGMVRQEHTAATADPRIEKRQFVRQIAPICAEIMGRGVPISEDTRTAKKIFDKRLPLARVLERLDAYRNGEGEEFRKPNAIADWIVGRLERDIVPRVLVENNDAAIKARLMAA